MIDFYSTYVKQIIFAIVNYKSISFPDSISKDQKNGDFLCSNPCIDHVWLFLRGQFDSYRWSLVRRANLWPWFSRRRLPWPLCDRPFWRRCSYDCHEFCSHYTWIQKRECKIYVSFRFVFFLSYLLLIFFRKQNISTL